MARRPYSELDCLRELVKGFGDSNPENVSIIRDENNEIETVVYYKDGKPYETYNFTYDGVGNLTDIDVIYGEE